MPTGWPPAEFPATIHGTAIAVEGQGALILGPSGSGKSSFALQMMAYGAGLISDDLVHLSTIRDQVTLSRPADAPASPGIEARGLGLLSVRFVPPAPLRLIVDLGELSTERLPEPVYSAPADIPIRVLAKVDNPAFAAMVLQHLRQPER